VRSLPFGSAHLPYADCVTQEPTESEIPSSWRQQAVERRLDPARTRAESRVQRFLDAAFEVMRDCDSAADFTVQEVVERSGQSLRSFYQYFGGKQELLLALFEEAVVSTAEHLHQQASTTDEPVERLHGLVVEYYRLCQPDPKRKTTGKHRPTPAMMEFAQQLLTSQPAHAARVFAPMVALFEQALEDATKSGGVRAGLPTRHVASTVLEAVMFNTFSTTIAGERPSSGVDRAELLWELFFNGISQAPTAAAAPRGRAQARSSR
jgi:AcrR family transcriptional regulator